MKKFKQIDAWVSIIGIIGFALVSMIRFDATFIIGYFAVGAWQVVSMLVHAINGWFCEKGSARYNYHWVVAVILVLALLGMAIYPLLFILLIALLFTAPFMAIGYASMCYKEVYEKMQRPLSQLK